MKNTLLIFCIMFLSFGIIYSEESIIPNAGQWPEKILAKASADGINVWVTGEGLVFDHYNIKPGLKSPGKFESNALDTINGCAYMLSFSSGEQLNKVINLNTDAEMPTVHNYFNDHKSNKAVSVKSYREITVDYQGFSLKLTVDNHKPRYDIILPPGYNPDNLKIEFKGKGCLDYSDNGSFKVVSGEEEYMHGGLKAFQKSGDKLQSVDCSPVITDSKHLIFKLGKYDETEELTIDPTVFSTFLGGEKGGCSSICINEDNNPVLSLLQNSKNYFPDSLKKYSKIGTGFDGIICCFQRDGKYPIWTSHFNELNIQKVSYLNNDTYKILGFAYDSMYTSDYAYCNKPDFDNGALVHYSCNLSFDGTTISNGSYWELLSKNFSFDNIRIDKNGNCCISINFNINDSLLIFKNPIRTTKLAKNDCALVILDSIDSDILFSSYWGYTKSKSISTIDLNNSCLAMVGPQIDTVSNLTRFRYISFINYKTFEIIDHKVLSDFEASGYWVILQDDKVTLFGTTADPNYPITENAHKADYWFNNFYITEFSLKDWKILKSGTFRGGVYDLSNGSFIRLKNNSYLISGNLQGGRLETTPDALVQSDAPRGQHHGFIMVVDSNLSDIQYCSYFTGKEFTNLLNETAIDSLSRIYACGITDSPDFPLYNAYDSAYWARTSYYGWFAAVEVSDETAIKENNSLLNRCILFPNPAQPGSLVTLSLDDEFAGETRIELIDISGRVIQEEKLSLFGAIRQDIQYQLPSELIPGAYFIRVSSGDNIIDFKLVVE